MEPPAKRNRVGNAPWDVDDDDELTLSASQFSARQDPMYQLDKKRAKSAFKLKSMFEDIFAKYGQDFEEVGDEINLHTGEIVVNNGHLQSLEDENQEKSEDEGEKAQLLQGKSMQPAKPNSFVPRGPLLHRNPRVLQRGCLQSPGPDQKFAPPPQLFGPPAQRPQNTGIVDPAWQTPEMQLPSIQQGGDLMRQSFGTSSWNIHGLQHSASGTGFGMGYGTFDALRQSYRRITTVKEIGPKALLESDTDGEGQSTDSEDQDDEDVLLGTSEDFAKAAARPHAIKPVEAIPIPCADLSQGSATQKTKDECKAATDKGQPRPRRGRPRKQPIFPAETVKVTKALGTNPFPQSSTQHGNDASTLRSASKHKFSSKRTSGMTVGLEAVKTKFREQTSIPEDTSDSQSRRSVRSRPPIQRYDQIDWPKSRQELPHVIHAITPPTETDLESSDQLVPPKQSELVPTLRMEQSDLDHPTREEVDSDSDRANFVSEPVIHLTQPSAVTVLNTRNSYFAEEAVTPGAEAPTSSWSRLTIVGSHAPSSSPPHSTSNDDVVTARPVVKQTVSTFKDVEEVKKNAYNTMLPLERDNSEELQTLNKPLPKSTWESVKLAKGIKRPTDAISSRVHSIELDTSAVSEDVGDSDISVELGEPISAEAGSPEGSNCASEPTVEPVTIQQPETVEFRDDKRVPAETTTPSVTSPTTRVLRPRKDYRSQVTNLPFRPSTKEPLQSPPLDVVTAQPAGSVSTREPSRTPAPTPPPVSTTSRSKFPPTKAHLRTPRKIRTLASLVSEVSDDEVELSVLSSSVARTPASNPAIRASFIRGASHTPSYIRSSPHQSHQHSVLVSTPPHLSLSRASSRHASPALPRIPHTDTGTIRYGVKRTQSNSGSAQSSPLARNVMSRIPQKHRNGRSVESSHAGSFADDMVQTPGGTVKRCGEDGFVCDRDFCFTCCE